jgi:hypothetical protein
MLTTAVSAISPWPPPASRPASVHIPQEGGEMAQP